MILAACGPSTLNADGSGVDLLTRSVVLGGQDALSTFVLEYDVDLNCFYHDEEDNNGEPGTGGRVVVQWPPGYTGTFLDGVGTVYDADGNIAAQTGVPVLLGGGGGPYTGDHCAAIGIWTVSP